MRISRQPFALKIMIDQKQPENVESYKYLGSVLTNDGKCTCEFKSRIAMAKLHSTRRGLFLLACWNYKMRKKLVKCYIWSVALYGADTWMLQAVDHKHLESSEMWCWRRMEKINWTHHVRNEKVLLRVNEQRNILHEISKWKANLNGHILHRNCLLQRVIEGKIRGKGKVKVKLYRYRPGVAQRVTGS
jgi:hypothetical protein